MRRGRTREDEINLADRRRRVASAYLRGMAQHEIARLEEVHQTQISRDLEAIRVEWSNRAVLDFGVRKSEELARIDQLEAVAWSAWERSRQDAEQFRIRTSTGRMRPNGTPAPDATQTVKTVKGQTGDPRFLDRVAWCIETRLKLIGALKDVAPTATTIVTVVAGIDLQVVTGDKPGISHADRRLASSADPGTAV